MRFHLVDRIHEWEPGKRLKASKVLTLGEEYLADHFPTFPVMPGVLMIEGMAQTAGVVCLRNMPPADERRALFFLTIDKCKFRKPAVPGDTLEYHVDKIAQRRNMWWYRAEAKVGSVLIAEAEVGAIITET